MRVAMRSLFVVMFSCAVFGLAGCSGGFDAELEEVAESLNAQCPVTVDSETQLIGVSVPEEKTLRYEYVLVNYVKADLTAEQITQLESFMRESLITQVKTAGEMAYLRENGVTFEYAYNTSDYEENGDSPAFSVVVTPDDYS